MDRVKYEMEVPKEGKELIDALAGIAKHFMEGQPIAAAAALLPSVMSAVDGIQKLGEELDSEFKDELAGYMIHKMWAAIDVKKVAVQPAEQPKP